jgi:hypothetical protein
VGCGIVWAIVLAILFWPRRIEGYAIDAKPLGAS